MKSWLLVLALLGGGEQEKGVALYEQGQYEQAIAAFRRAEAADGPSAELSYNLALALWKAGQLDEAETEAERAATLSDGRLSYLRDGVLGNLRFAAAKGKEAEDLQGALAAAEQARDHYLRGSLAAADAPELARNLERSLRLIEELRKKIDEQKKQEKQDDQKQDENDKNDEQKDDEKGEPKDGQKNDDEQQQKQDDQQKQDQQRQPSQEGKSEEQPEPQPKQGEEKQPEPQQQPTPDEQQKGEQQPPSGAEQNAEAAPGEHDPSKELTPEQKMQLLRELEKFDQQLQKLRALQRAQRPKVEKDW